MALRNLPTSLAVLESQNVKFIGYTYALNITREQSNSSIQPCVHGVPQSENTTVGDQGRDRNIGDSLDAARYHAANMDSGVVLPWADGNSDLLPVIDNSASRQRLGSGNLSSLGAPLQESILEVSDPSVQKPGEDQCTGSKMFYPAERTDASINAASLHPMPSVPHYKANVTVTTQASQEVDTHPRYTSKSLPGDFDLQHDISSCRPSKEERRKSFRLIRPRLFSRRLSQAQTTGTGSR